VLVETSGRVDDLSHDRLVLRKVREQAGHAVAPALSAQRQEGALDRVLGRLLGREACPLVISGRDRMARMVQVTLRLRQPVRCPVHH